LHGSLTLWGIAFEHTCEGRTGPGISRRMRTTMPWFLNAILFPFFGSVV
jgi:hypothetical protein